MIYRYAKPEAIAIWSDQRKYSIMLEIELLACEAMEEIKEIPDGIAAACRLGSKCLLPDKFPVERIIEIENTTKHDVIAFLTMINETIGESARYLHKGMTSSDVLDTAFAIQLKESGELILNSLNNVLQILEALSHKHAFTLCMGRSHGIHAEPTTFGMKMAILWDQLRRDKERLSRATKEVAVGKLSGVVGTFAHLDPRIEEYVCQHLGLTPSPISNQIIQRDLHAHYFHCLALLATSIEKIVVEIRNLQRTEIMEVMEPFSDGQKGSSAMPHKRNPILSENLCGLARLVRGYADSAMENVVLWHERDISHSSVERVIGPDATVTVHFMLERLNEILSGLQILPNNMLKNIELTGGAFVAQRIMLALVEKGLSREEAYTLVQNCAAKSWSESRLLYDVVLESSDLKKYLNKEDLDVLFNLDWYTRKIGKILDRVFTV